MRRIARLSLVTALMAGGALGASAESWGGSCGQKMYAQEVPITNNAAAAGSRNQPLQFRC